MDLRYHRSNGNGGSLDGAYSLRDISVTSVAGGTLDSAMGPSMAIQEQLPASGIGGPRHIKAIGQKNMKRAQGSVLIIRNFSPT